MKVSSVAILLLSLFQDGSAFTSPLLKNSGNKVTQLKMAGFGGATTSKGKGKNKKKKSEQPKFDVSAALLRSEKLYDKLSTESTKAMMREEETDVLGDTIFSEFVVAARYNPPASNQKPIAGASSVSDWTPVGQICILRSRNNGNEDGRLPPQLTEAISANCREIHHAAVVGAPIFASLPRNDIEYSVETVDSFFKFVYDNVLEENSKKKNKNDKEAVENMTKKEARIELELEEDCSDLSQIKKAYRSLSFKFHPDRFVIRDIDSVSEDEIQKNEEKKKDAQEKYSRVKYAYELLIRSGVTANGSSSSPTSTSVTGNSWYASLGGRERTDFMGPLELIPLKTAQSDMERCIKTEGGYKSAVCGLDPELVNSFTIRNQSNAALYRSYL